jgi:hypothetical protein
MEKITKQAEWIGIYNSLVRKVQRAAVMPGAARADENGILCISHGNTIVIGYVGEDGIKPNTYYRLNDKHDFVEVKESGE